jgi:hypothetical protein
VHEWAVEVPLRGEVLRRENVTRPRAHDEVPAALLVWTAVLAGAALSAGIGYHGRGN